jgi:hypothetical protein
VTIPVVVQKTATCAPTDLFLIKSRLVSHIGERAISVVMEKHVMPPEAAEQVIPSIVVVVANAHACLPTGYPQSRFLCDISKGALAVVLVEMRSWRLARRPMCIEPISIREIDVEPSIVVIVEKS